MVGFLVCVVLQLYSFVVMFVGVHIYCYKVICVKLL